MTRYVQAILRVGRDTFPVRSNGDERAKRGAGIRSVVNAVRRAALPWSVQPNERRIETGRVQRVVEIAPVRRKSDERVMPLDPDATDSRRNGFSGSREELLDRSPRAHLRSDVQRHVR